MLKIQTSFIQPKCHPKPMRMGTGAVKTPKMTYKHHKYTVNLVHMSLVGYISNLLKLYDNFVWEND